MAVHSPLDGPETVRPLAAALAAIGWSTMAPDLRGAAIDPYQFAQRAIDEAGCVDIVVGHSGGAVLSTVAKHSGAVSAIYIDAVVFMVRCRGR